MNSAAAEQHERAVAWLNQRAASGPWGVSLELWDSQIL